MTFYRHLYQVIVILVLSAFIAQSSQNVNKAFYPLILRENKPVSTQVSSTPDVDWPQLGHDSQRTNYTLEQVDPPYCYAWKWYQVPIASRAQPVVSQGKLFIGGMDGTLYARDATTGAPLWDYPTLGPIRHSPAVLTNTVIVSSYDGYTYAFNSSSGKLVWKNHTGPSAAAPLIDTLRRWIYIASTNGQLYALRLSDGKSQWIYDSKAPILTTPSLSQDGQTIFLGNEAIYAIAVKASTGIELWRTHLQGQSLADRYPLVTKSAVIYRSQPLYNFHLLLHEGDVVMDSAGVVQAGWSKDWSIVRPKILDYLKQQPSKQTFFILNPATGSIKGIAPILYTFGLNDIPAAPVVNPADDIYLPYRARHGIQTDSQTVHVTTKYDAELGIFNPSSLDISALTSDRPLSGQPEFRLTSDEPAVLTMGGNILWVDNWERLGGIDVSSNALIHVGGVSNQWPECGGECSPGTSNPFFPLHTSQPAYPFPNPRITEGGMRGGAVIANGMIYWRVIEAGLAGISHRTGTACPSPKIWTALESVLQNQSTSTPAVPSPKVARPLAEYVTLDLTTPVSNPDKQLVESLRQQVKAILQARNHLLPFFLERGFSTPFMWPYNSTDPPHLPQVQYQESGNVFWQDPGELLYTLALSYPYLDSSLKIQVKDYIDAEMTRYPPLSNLPWSGTPPPTWLVQGSARELYAVPFRSSLNNWPPPAVNLSVLYSIWLWSKNTGDWTYARSHWTEIKNFFKSDRNAIEFYADIAGVIGYARLAAHFGYSTDYQSGLGSATNAMRAGLDFETFQQRAANQYLDAREEPTGLSVPVFFGLTPEIGLYLREQFKGEPIDLLLLKENVNDGVRWWYLTRVGNHGEAGESSYLLPFTAWSHFLAHAYIVGDDQATLKKWLDRPWGIGDLYAIQKIVSAIQAPP
jgi:outer membrane lipoprotein-sorting protein